MYRTLKRLLIGAPIASQRAHHEKLNVPLGLAVFASDALSSTAYATDEILLALAGTAYASHMGVVSLPVALTIVALIAIVVISYREIIKAYPEGGGAYIVARQNLGQTASHVAASALLIDYILTVAVSISAGVAALTSTGLLPHEHATPLCVVFTLAIMVINLRGVKESGGVIAFPAYLFILSMLALVGFGLYKMMSGQAVVSPGQAIQEVGQEAGSFTSLAFILVFLKAFSHGCAGLTGIEAVSNGVKAFKEPSALRANQTMGLMGLLLAGIFLGVTIVAFGFNIVPKAGETVVSQVARHVFGGGTALYFTVQFSTMVILILAANTAFAGFPAISSMLANDGFLPRQLMNVGDRLVFNNGIIVLALLAVLLIVLFHGDTHALIPLYAVGVFVSFTLAQSGMVLHHRRVREPGFRRGTLVNAFGACMTGFVTLVIAVEKFREGAWIILIAIPVLIWLFRKISSHYKLVGKQLTLPTSGYCPVPIEHTVLVLVSSLNRGTVPALEYAKTISNRVEAVHVELKADATERLRRAWDEWGCGIPLTILKSPFRSITEPLLNYIAEVENRYEHDLVTIIVPEFVTRKWWHNLLHNQSAMLIKALLRMRRGKVVTTIRYYLEE